MDNQKKNYLSILIGVLILILLGVIFYLLRKMDGLRSDIKELKRKDPIQIGDNTVKPVPTQVTPSTIETEIKDRGLPVKEIKEDANKSGSNLTGVTTIVIKTDGEVNSGGKSTRSEPAPVIIKEIPQDCKCPYVNTTEHKMIYERFGNEEVPFSEIGFTASSFPNPWSFKTFPRIYKVSTVIAEDENHKKTTYSNFQLEVEGKIFKLPIQDADLVYTDPPSVLRWNPRLFMNMNVGLGFPILSENPANVSLAWGPSVGMTMASYGKYKSSPDWYFGELCVGYDIQSASAFFGGYPFLYRISNHIPFTESLYLGPGINMDIKGNLSFLLGLGLGL